MSAPNFVMVAKSASTNRTNMHLSTKTEIASSQHKTEWKTKAENSNEINCYSDSIWYFEQSVQNLKTLNEKWKQLNRPLAQLSVEHGQSQKFY